MPDIFCLLNHELTPKQKEELNSSFGAKNIIYPPASVSTLWAVIPTEKELTKTHLEPFIYWLQEAKPGDTVILQGEHSATFALADYALQKGLIPLCAVSERMTQEVQEGEKVIKKNVFEHICFRKFQYYKYLD